MKRRTAESKAAWLLGYFMRLAVQFSRNLGRTFSQIVDIVLSRII
jgi:hypothetical protein